jgi:hypothetical protein
MRFKEIHSENFLRLKEAIVKTVAYFDMFDYPLTGFEIWQFLEVKCELFEVIGLLEGGLSALESRKGFYFLGGRSSIVAKRLSRYRTTDRKFNRAVFLARIYKYIPWIKMIAVGNLMGSHNLKAETDIDLFIVTEAKRIWLSRFFCVSLINLFGWRPKPGSTKDKICLSFFTSETALDLNKFRLSQDDWYFNYWLANLTPIYQKDGIYEKLIQANGWLEKTLPNWEKRLAGSARRDAGRGPEQFYHEVVDLFFGGLEQWFKGLQFKLMPKNLQIMMNKDTRVVINDKILKLHTNDRREEYREQFMKKIKSLS